MRSIVLFLTILSLVPARAADPPPYQPVAGPFESKPSPRVERRGSRRIVPVKIYYPRETNGPLPVVIFSHGLGGSREGYAYLGRAWASAGYVSVHLQHPGSDTAVTKGGMATMKAAATPKSAVDRTLDVKFAIDQLTKMNEFDKVFKSKLDLTKVGMSGHSFRGPDNDGGLGPASGASKSQQRRPPDQSRHSMSSPVPLTARGWTKHSARSRSPACI